MNKKIFAGLLLGVALLFSCNEPVPIKEMTNARIAIDRALSVRADKYAAEKIGEAKNLLLAAHDQIKDEKYDDAKKSSEDAEIKANEAYDESVPLLAKDAIAAAEENLALANEAYAAELARDEYNAASAKLDEAQKLFEEKKYYDAFLQANVADEKAKAARTAALLKKDTLRDAIAAVESVIVQSKKYDSEKYASDKLRLAAEHLTLARKSYGELKIRDGFAAIEIARINADEAYVAALKGTAQTEINNSEKVLVNASAVSEEDQMAPNELEGAKALLATAKDQFNRKLYVEAIDSARESRRLGNSALEINRAHKARLDAMAAEAAEAEKNRKAAAASNGLPEGWQIYVVQNRTTGPKDCLRLISQKYYGTENKWNIIYNANRDLIKNPDLIYPGWRLKIPGLAMEEKKPVPPTVNEPEAMSVPVDIAPAEKNSDKPAEEKPSTGNNAGSDATEETGPGVRTEIELVE